MPKAESFTAWPDNLRQKVGESMAVIPEHSNCHRALAALALGLPKVYQSIHSALYIWEVYSSMLGINSFTKITLDYCCSVMGNDLI